MRLVCTNSGGGGSCVRASGVVGESKLLEYPGYFFLLNRTRRYWVVDVCPRIKRLDQTCFYRLYVLIGEVGRGHPNDVGGAFFHHC